MGWIYKWWHWREAEAVESRWWHREKKMNKESSCRYSGTGDRSSVRKERSRGEKQQQRKSLLLLFPRPNICVAAKPMVRGDGRAEPV